MKTKNQPITGWFFLLTTIDMLPLPFIKPIITYLQEFIS